MTWKWVAVLGMVLLVAQCSQEPPAPKTQQDKVSYGIGVSVARNFKQQGIEVDLDMVKMGMKDELSGGKLLLSDGELRSTMRAFQNDLMRKQAKSRMIAKLDNKKAGDAFLAENKKKEGVVTLPNGLQYKILKAGDGKKPKDADTVEVKYRGTLIDGKEFDSSADTEPAVFKVSEIIAGWREALKLMPVGSKWQLFIPPELAYGELGSGQVIGPNATLIFEVDLLAIK